MLIVTFGRAASQELRERVRLQLARAEQALADAVAGRPPAGADTLLDLLLDATRRRRWWSVGTGCATRSSTSTRRRSPPPTSSASWCCAASGWRATPTRVPAWSRTSTTCSCEVVDDLYVRGFAGSVEEPVFDRRAALQVARAAVGDPQARLEPQAAPEGTLLPGGWRSPTPYAASWTCGSAGSGCSATTTCSAGWPRPRRRGRTGPAADAGPVAGGARRRVPGHRPGAVAGARPGVLRPRDDGAHR